MEVNLQMESGAEGKLGSSVQEGGKEEDVEGKTMEG